MTTTSLIDENAKLFDQEAILSYQEKRRPDYNIERLKLKFPNKSTIKPVTAISSTDYNYSNYSNYNIDEPLLNKNCKCIIL